MRPFASRSAYTLWDRLARIWDRRAITPRQDKARLSVLPLEDRLVPDGRLVSVVAADPVAAEGTPGSPNPGSTGSFRFIRTGSTADPLIVNYTVSGTATPAGDYPAPPGTITIPAGESTASVLITPPDDGIAEDPEDVVVQLQSGGGYAIGVDNSATVTIEDAPTPVVTARATTPVAAEGGAAGAVTFYRTGSPVASLTVGYTIDGSATADSDYSALSGSVTFAAGETEVTVTVTPVDDDTSEDPETVTVTLNSPPWTGGPDQYQLGTPATATVVILDNDPLPTITVIASDPYTTEGGTAGFTLRRTGDTSTPLTVSIGVSGGSYYGGWAESGDDFETLPATITFEVGQSEVTVPLNTHTDDLVEGTELVSLYIQPNSDYVLGTPSAATADIFDGTPTSPIDLSDPEEYDYILTLSNSALSESGPTDATLTITLISWSRNINYPWYVDMYYDVGMYGSTATAATVDTDGDFQGWEEFVIPAGSWSVDVPVHVLDDHEVEGPETMVFSARTGRAVAVIADDDESPTVTLAPAGDADEDGLTDGHFVLTRTGDLSEELTVWYQTVGGAGAWSDYEALPGYVTFPAGEATVELDVVPLADDAVEGPEALAVSLLPDPSYVVGASYQAAITIQDAPVQNTVYTVSVEAVDPDATEVGWTDPNDPDNTRPSSGGFLITRSGGDFSDPLTVAYSVGGTATNGSDYALLSGTAVIPGGSTSVFIPVDAETDDLLEGDETVTLTLCPGTGYLVASEQQPAEVTIADMVDVTGEEIQGMQGIELSFERVAKYLNQMTDESRLDEVSALIQWGDGDESGGWLERLDAAPDHWQVHGFHTYAEPGTFPITVELMYEGEIVGWGSGSAVIVPFLAKNDYYYMSHDRVLSTDSATYGPGVLVNDVADGLQITDHGAPGHGTLAFDTASGTFTYTPETGYVGTDTFTYTVQYRDTSSTATVTIYVRNVAPVAQDDDYYIAPAGEDGSYSSNYTTDDDGFSGTVLYNDFDTEDELTVSLETGPSHGILTLNTDGTFTYTPDESFTGSDSFVYTVTDGIASSSATATIEVDDGTYLPPPGVLVYIPADASTQEGTVFISFEGGAGGGQPPPPAPGAVPEDVKEWFNVKKVFQVYKDRLRRDLNDKLKERIQLLGDDDNNALWVTPQGKVAGAYIIGDVPKNNEIPREYGLVQYLDGKPSVTYFTPLKDKEGKFVKNETLTFDKNGLKGTYVDASGMIITFDKFPTSIKYAFGSSTVSITKDSITVSDKDGQILQNAQFFLTLNKMGAKAEFKFNNGGGGEISNSGVKIKTALGYEFAASWTLSPDFKTFLINGVTAKMPLGESGVLEAGYARPGAGQQSSFRLSYTNKKYPDRTLEVRYQPRDVTTNAPPKLVVTAKLKWGGRNRDLLPPANASIGLDVSMDGNNIVTFGLTFEANF